MAKKPSKKTIKKKAWSAFSQYIRRKYADENGYCSCVTCGKTKHWSEQQAGHFVGGRGNAVLFNEDCVRIQCVHCNIFLRGNYQAYTIYMIDQVGRQEVDRLLALKNTIVKLSIQDLLDVEEKYKRLASEL